MEYEGKLYGKIDGKYFDTGKSTDDWDRMVGALIEANKVLSKMNYNPDAKSINRLHHGIKFALKKAGCQL